MGATMMIVALQASIGVAQLALAYYYWVQLTS